jgi:hypothetical protein
MVSGLGSGKSVGKAFEFQGAVIADLHEQQRYDLEEEPIA